MENTTGKSEGIGSGNSEGSKSTQFGGDNANPMRQDTNMPHGESIRKSVRHLARQPIVKDRHDKYKINMPVVHTYAQAIAAVRIIDALETDSASDRLRAAEYLTEQLDGKLAQVNLNAEAAAIEGMSDDEIQRELDGLRGAAQRVDAAAPAECTPPESPITGG